MGLMSNCGSLVRIRNLKIAATPKLGAKNQLA
jgi:hypothetical protein